VIKITKKINTNTNTNERARLTNNIDKHITNFKKTNYEKIVDIVEGNKTIETPVKKYNFKIAS
jgi:hypothetical protein